MKILKKVTLSTNKYTSYKKTTFLDKFGNEKSWEFIERNNDTKAVIINVIDDNKIILVKQFRIPLNKFSIEFPAGLIDPGESIENSAERELLEETGFQGKVLSISPPICTSAGITDEIVYLVDMKLTSSTQFKQDLDETEEIEVVVFDKKSLNIKKDILDYLDIVNSDNNKTAETVIDSKVWATYFEN